MKPTYLLIALVALATVWGCHSKTEQATETAAADSVTDATIIPVRLAAVEQVERAEPVVASGLVSSSEEARLSFKIGGIVNKLYVDEGQTVRKGQLLATLNLTEIDAQVSQAQLGQEKAERDLARVKKLYADTAATLEQLQNATTGSNVARQNLTIAQFNRGYAQIRASVDGTVTRKLVNEGEFVAAGAGVYLLSGNRRNDWVVRVGVADKDWARLKLGDRATIALDAYPDRSFSGTITELGQAADPMNKLYEVEIRLNPAGARLAPGLFAKATLTPTQRRTYAMVPIEAIVEGNGKDGFVYVLATRQAATGPQRVRKQPIQIGYISGTKVLLTGGLQSVNQVVTSGSAFLTEDSRVAVK
ncbi:efflux transporter, RND family, MFP subunit [Fibrella aestuarina BUZ 2]|uniref:Efflux transporter, RND family, MFP subunit n=1 Tax=Fibrella aestuarina BUZ 2 TaxID=1166018 RepID=I0K591_9BACT|nr:efflux RND transporter periplasmic adaptor subunit [Fibrella aestuarina]CCG99294.1 efflux transporter, RND family, MFP subunit [Fibrella aestuarina BUZ 2]